MWTSVRANTDRPRLGQRRVTDNLAWRKNLSKTRAVMKISAPSRILGLGQGANNRLFCAAFALGACFALACSDDAPAQQTGLGGSTGGADPDASVRDLPGDGREATPDFDTESRQRTPIGPRQLVETVDEIRDYLGLGPGGSGAADAGPVDAGPADGGAN
jgi:hypothetical protein